MQGIDSKHKQIVIYNMIGEEVAKYAFYDLLELDLQYLPPGIYCYKVTTELGFSEIGKIIKV